MPPRLLILLCLAFFLSGCKLAVIVVEGGKVQSTVSGNCLAGNVCVQEITAADFSETYTAVPDTGWYFDGWVTGEGFFCDQNTGPTCVLNNVGLGGVPAVTAVIASDTAFYLMPRFTKASPITDTVTVNGLEWAQVDLILDVPWAEINAACPLGSCSNGAVLNGYDMTGWSWASLSEVGGLFQATTPHPGGIAEYSEIFTGVFQWADDFMDVVGFRATFTIPILTARVVSGYASGPGVEPKAHIQRFEFPDQYAAASTTGVDTATPGQERNGAWFFRVP